MGLEPSRCIGAPASAWGVSGSCVNVEIRHFLKKKLVWYSLAVCTAEREVSLSIYYGDDHIGS